MIGLRYGETAAATAARGAYVVEVQQLVADQTEVLFRMVSAAAERASTGAQPIAVARAAGSLTASVGARAVVFDIAAITDRPGDLDRAWAFMTGQARCTVVTPDGPPAVWVLALQGVGAGGARAQHIWMDVRARTPLTEAVVAATLQSLHVLSE